MPGQLFNGKWVDNSEIPNLADPNNREFKEKVMSDGSSGFPAEAGRYHLYFSFACPFAHRPLLAHALCRWLAHNKSLDDVVSKSPVDTTIGAQGWSFGVDKDLDTSDPVFGASYLHEIYTKSDPSFTGRVVVPCLLDKKTGKVVSNSSLDIMRMFDTEFKALHGPEAPNLYPHPAELATKIDALNEWMHPNVNRGPYACGFAADQQSYDAAVEKLFAALDEMDTRLKGTRYLHGNDCITENDLLLFASLVRFDTVYYFLFKCSKKRIQDYDNLSRFVRELYEQPAIKATVRIDIIRNHYYTSMPFVNPKLIVAKTPTPSFML